MLRIMNLLGFNLFSIAALACAIIFVHAARAEPGLYTTKTEEETLTGVDAQGNAFERTTTTTHEAPISIDAKNRLDAWENDPNAENFPYDSTGGSNRSDVDTARQGFDDPRNPWDGRYSNDNPANHPVGSAYDRGEPITNYSVDRFRPGAFGTSGSGD